MVPLYPKAIEVLACLVERHGQVTTKEDLLAKVWPDTFVEEGALTRSISVLRKALAMLLFSPFRSAVTDL
jgi:DNA-binding winged helix-turn-helix (wHTH) protein